MHGSKVCGNLLVMNFKVLVYSVSFPNPESLKNQKLEAWGVGGRAPHSEWWGGGSWGGPPFSAAVPFLQVSSTVWQQA